MRKRLEALRGKRHRQSVVKGVGVGCINHWNRGPWRQRAGLDSGYFAMVLVLAL